MFQYRIWHNDIEGNLGLALSHPLYHIIGIAVKYTPLGEFAYRINLISAVAATFTVANLFLLLRLWLGKNLPAILAAITLAVSWTHWQFASIAEVYTLYSALFLAELIVLLQYVKTRRAVFLYLLGLFNGLAIAVHMFASIGFICYLAFLMVLLTKKQISLKHFAVITGLWVAGAVSYEYLIIKNIIQTGNFSATIASALFGDNDNWQRAVLNTHLSARIIKENIIFMAYNFATPNVLFFFAGLYGLKKLSPSRGFRNIILALLVLFFGFAFRYTVPDRYAFFMPFYCIVSILIGVGFDVLVIKPNRRIMTYLVFIASFITIPVYIAAPIAAQQIGFKLPTKREIPYRNDYVWFLRPWQSGNHGPEQFANEIFSMVQRDAVIYADGTTVYPLLYVQQVKGLHKDVIIVTSHGTANNLNEYGEDVIADLLAKRDVYVVSPVKGYCPDFLLKRYDFTADGILWRVVERQRN
ncbi:MAG: protein O-mannosyl-transferase family [Planctomycetota bacterium]